MMAKKAMMALLLLSIIACLSLALKAQGAKRLWVLKDSGEIVEYNPLTWAVQNRIPVPAEAVGHPERLSISRNGRMLFGPISGYKSATLPEGSAPPKLWVWDGRKVISFDLEEGSRSVVDRGGNVRVQQTVSRYSLSADGRSLYGFENRLQILKDPRGAELSVSTEVLAWQSDLAGRERIRLVDFHLPRCECGTGVCSESCPEAAFWLPDEGVAGFFFLTRWIPGQIGAVYESTSLFRRSGGNWSERRFNKALEKIEDAGRGGDVVIYSVPDGACCGWNNAGNDQTILIAEGKERVIFDEFDRFGNSDYDVSFFISTARLSPDLESIAMTIQSTATPGAEIRLSDQGKPNPEALARIRKSLAALPAVEAVQTGDPSHRSAFYPNTILVGWLDDREVLVVEKGTLAALNAWTGARRSSPIQIADESRVFLR
jgi:hypothetical protein